MTTLDEIKVYREAITPDQKAHECYGAMWDNNGTHSEDFVIAGIAKAIEEYSSALQADVDRLNAENAGLQRHWEALETNVLRLDDVIERLTAQLAEAKVWLTKIAEYQADFSNGMVRLEDLNIVRLFARRALATTGRR